MARIVVPQGKIPPVVPEQVSYSKAIPKGLWSFLPRGGTSRFWGESNITYHEKKVWVHVYDVRKTQFVKEATAEDGKQDSGLDLFVFSKKHQLTLISSTLFTYPRFGGYKRGGDFETIGVGVLWLDPKSQKMPIVDVLLNNPHGLYGTITQDVICVFNKGIAEKAVVDSRFGKGDSNAANFVHWDTGFALMSNGLSGVCYLQARQGYLITYYKWEADQFRMFRKVRYDADSDEVVEVPLDSQP